MRTMTLASLIAAGMFSATAAVAQQFPVRPIRFVVPFPPGGRAGSRRGGWLGGGDRTRPPGWWHRIRQSIPLALAAAGTLGASTVVAQQFPVRPIRFVVPFPPGGSTDLLARVIGKKLVETTGQQVIIDNRAGASGIIGTQIVAAAAPDGYTLAMVYTPHTTTPSLFDKLPYDPIRDFSPVTQVMTAPLLMLVHPSVPARDVKELIALAKAQPGYFKFASSSNGSAGHLAGVLLRTMTRTDMTHVPFKGSGQAMTDLLAGHINLMFDGVLAARPQVKAGRLRALAVTSTKRSSAFPDLPTVAESGLTGFEVIAWAGVLAPAHTNRHVIDRLNTLIVNILKAPELNERLAGEGADPIGNSPTEFAEFIRGNIAYWQKFIKQSGARLD